MDVAMESKSTGRSYNCGQDLMWPMELAERRDAYESTGRDMKRSEKLFVHCKIRDCDTTCQPYMAVLRPLTYSFTILCPWGL